MVNKRQQEDYIRLNNNDRNRDKDRRNGSNYYGRNANDNMNHHRSENGGRYYDEFGRGRTSNNGRPSSHPHPPPPHPHSHYHQRTMMICEGNVYKGEIKRIEPYGCFVSIETERDRATGLVHISQISNTHRVENINDEVKMDQSCYVLVLEVTEERHRRKIRLSMSAVNQNTGEVLFPPSKRSQSSFSRRSGGNNNRVLEERSRERVDSWKTFGYSSWNRTDENSYLHSDLSYNRILWNSSPGPPTSNNASGNSSGKKAAEKSKDQKKKKSYDSSSSDSSVSSSSSRSYSSSSSSSSESDVSKSRRRSSNRKRKYSSSKGKNKKQDKRRNRRNNSKRSRHRKRRRYSSSSSSGSDSDSSASSSSSSSTSSSKSRKSSEKENAVKSDLSKKGKEQEEKGHSEEINNVNAKEELHVEDLRQAEELKKAIQSSNNNNKDSDDEDDLDGPQPLSLSNQGDLDPNGTGGAASGGNAYGKALLPGEGVALAQYVQQNLRIPRRGEIGYSSNDIESYEKSGYVMSGSRHARMNAVRIRKENQVYSAEEQRALALITMEENQQKEAKLIQDFREMLKERRNNNTKKASDDE